MVDISLDAVVSHEAVSDDSGHKVLADIGGALATCGLLGKAATQYMIKEVAD